MRCPRCDRENDDGALRCVHCGGSTAVATLELLRGSLPEKVHFLAPRSYTLGRAAHNDILLEEPSISKAHARIRHEQGRFVIEDTGSLHGVYVDMVKAKRAELRPGAEIQLGNATFRFSPLKAEGSTDRIADLPWVEHQQLLLSLVQSLNSTLVLSSVLEQVLAGVMGITRAERGFLLLTEGPDDGRRYPSVAGLRLMLGRGCDGGAIVEPSGISSSVVRKAMESGETMATGNAVADPALGLATSVILMDLRTIVCIPLLSPRRTSDAVPAARAVGALYVDNPRTSTSFPPDSLRAAEALAHHAALAIENAQLFERGQRTIEELRIAQKQLLQSEKLATIGQMAAGIAHELNTPLTYILGNLELLQSQSLGAEQRDMLESVWKGAERIRTLARSLLAFSRPSSQEEPIPLAVNELVERALDLCRYQIVKAGITLEKHLAFGLAPVLGVSNQLEMALINLIVNAAQALDGRETRVLRLATEEGDGVVRIRISDTGPGIPASLQASVFEPFVTTKSEGHGTGLGLSTVLMVVERHGGRIDMETASEKGTTFTITLPASRQPAASPPPPPRG